MCYFIITKSVKVIAETSVQHVIRDNLLDPKIASQIEELDKALNKQLDENNFNIKRMGHCTFKNDNYNLPQWDPAYRDNTPDDD